MAYNSDQHRYFLSIYDYLQWLKTSIGIADTVEFWDRIQHFTPHKYRELEEYDKELIKKKHPKICLAFSCIAFEFWLILHFEQNTNAFLLTFAIDRRFCSTKASAEPHHAQKWQVVQSKSAVGF